MAHCREDDGADRGPVPRHEGVARRHVRPEERGDLEDARERADDGEVALLLDDALLAVEEVLREGVALVEGQGGGHWVGVSGMQEDWGTHA